MKIYQPKTYDHAGKKHKNELWDDGGGIFVHISHAWLGKPEYRLGYLIEVKRYDGVPSKRVNIEHIETHRAFTKENAMKIAMTLKKKYHIGEKYIDSIYGRAYYHHTETDDIFQSNSSRYSYANGYAVKHFGNSHEIYKIR